MSRLVPTAPLLATALFVFLVAQSTVTSALTCLPWKAGYDLSGEKVRFNYRDHRYPDKTFDRAVEEADKSTFRVLKHPFWNVGSCGDLVFNYGRDARHVFHQGRVIEGADPETFVFFHRSYARDKHGIYGPSRRISERVMQFRLIDDAYATDGVRHFHEDVVIDEPGFELMEPGYGYARTSTRVFRFGKVLEGVDARTFEVTWPVNSTTRDKNHVYFQDRPIHGADPVTFELISPHYLFRDRRAVYLEGQEIVGADPKTARPSEFHVYTIDRNHVFRGTKKLERDVASFEELQPPWSKDRFGIYHDDKRVPEADLATFRAISVGSAEDRNYRYQSGRIACKIAPEAPGHFPECRGR